MTIQNVITGYTATCFFAFESRSLHLNWEWYGCDTQGDYWAWTGFYEQWMWTQYVGDDLDKGNMQIAVGQIWYCDDEGEEKP